MCYNKVHSTLRLESRKKTVIIENIKKWVSTLDKKYLDA